MKRRKRPYSQRGTHDAQFKKSLVSYVLMLIFFGFLFLRTGVPSFVFFIVVIPMTISIIHKYIDSQNKEEYISPEEDDIYDSDDKFPEEDWEEDALELEDMKTLRKEWKDSDLV